MLQAVLGRSAAFRYLLVAAIVALATMQLAGSAPPVAAQGTATIEIVNVDADTGSPAPFTRFQVTSENGTVYGPLETDLNGYVAFSVTVDPQGTSFTVEEETPPACATPPDPQITEPLAAGESVSLSFSTQDQPGCGLGTIALYAMACPEGFSGPADDYGPWRDGCTGTIDGTGFTLTSNATGESWYPVAGAYGIPGRAPVVGLPAGDYTFQQEGDSPAAVFCLIYDTANYATSPQPGTVEPVSLTDGVGTISLSGNRVSCDLFTVPGGAAVPTPTVEAVVVEPVSTASLEVHVAACPPGYLAGATIYDDCHGNGVSGAPVRVSGEGGFAGAIATTLPETPGPGVARFDGLAAGTYTVAVDMPAGTSVSLYCSDESDTQVPAAFDDATGAFTVELAGGAVVTCDWYELPQQVEPAEGTSSLEMHALVCPNGTDPESGLYDICHGNGASGATYSVSGPNGYTRSATTTVPESPGPGVALFSALVEGSYTVTQEAVDPADTLVVYCSLADADAVVPFTYVDADTIALDLAAGTRVVCDWYLIPPPDQSTTLQVTKYTCPVGMVAGDSTTLAEFQLACTDLTDDVDFTLAPLGQQGSVLTTGSAGPGTVLFESLPSGNFSLTEDIPEEFSTPWAFCGLEGGDLQPYTWIRGGDPLQIDAAAGTYVCEWFNVPEDLGSPSSITVTKYLCPPGIDKGYAARCGSSPLAGATFELEGPGQYQADALTGPDGVAWFGELSSGRYTLTEIPPAGTNVAVYVVSCEAGGNDFETTYNDRTGMRIELDLPSGTDVTCNWYNIPPGSPTVTPDRPQGSITVHKFICLGKSVGSYNWDIDCNAESAPAGFSLKSSDGRPIAVGTTNSQGILAFTGLTNGAYDLDETTGDWCHAEADRVDSSGNVLVAGGGNTDVYIYNCSLKQVGRLPSTGTGTQVSAPASRFESEKAWELLLAAMATIGIALVMRRQLQRAVVRTAAGPSDDAPGPNPGEERLS